MDNKKLITAIKILMYAFKNTEWSLMSYHSVLGEPMQNTIPSWFTIFPYNIREYYIRLLYSSMTECNNNRNAALWDFFSNKIDNKDRDAVIKYFNERYSNTIDSLESI